MANDTDQSKASSHHTLGVRSTQASPGDHTHDGSTSLSLSGLYMDLSTTQTAAGQKTFTGTAIFSAGLWLNTTTGAGAALEAVAPDASHPAIAMKSLGNDMLRGYSNTLGNIFTIDGNGAVNTASLSDPALFFNGGPVNNTTWIYGSIAGVGKIRIQRDGGIAALGLQIKSGTDANGTVAASVDNLGAFTGQRSVLAGAQAGMNFSDRGGGGLQWEWYSSGNVARLWNSSTFDQLTIDTAGKLTAGNLVTDSSYTPAWYDNSGGQPTAFTGTGSFRFGQYQRVGKSIIGDAYITVGSGGGITAGKISFDLPVSVSGSFPGGMVGVWYTGNGDQGFIKSGYNVTKCDLVHADGSNYTATPTNGQQFVCRFHYIGN